MTDTVERWVGSTVQEEALSQRLDSANSSDSGHVVAHIALLGCDERLEHAHLTLDMPFMSYQVSAEQALLNAGRAVKESGCQSVKLEGGERTAAAISRIVEAGIPVVGHVGLTPQSVHAMGGFKGQ